MKRKGAPLAKKASTKKRTSSKRSFQKPGELRQSYAKMTSELKALDVPNNTVLVNTTAVITPLNLIRAGSTFCNRIGRKIEMESARLVGALVPVRTVVNQDYVRIMIVYDRQTNGALPAIADILQTTDQATANTTGTLSGVNLNNRDRFVILKDHHVTLPSFTDTAGVITN